MPPKQKIALALPTVVSLSELATLTPHQQSTRLYRRFVRLAVFLPLHKYRMTYLSLLRDRFTSDYNARHIRIMGNDPQVTPGILLQRAVNTLGLLNRSFHYEDDDMSTTIVMNMIKFEQSKQLYISKNHQNKSLTRQILDYEYHDTQKKESKQWEGWRSARDYDKTLLRFNESMKMSL